jgi:tripartite-type tricarboxylate transporter receptor subunit TctC
MGTSLRFSFMVVCALAIGIFLPADAPAQEYPKHPITVIVPFAVGGLTDVPVRVLTAMLQERIGQTIVVENKPGGSGTLGGAYPPGPRRMATLCSPIRSLTRKIYTFFPCPITQSMISR